MASLLANSSWKSDWKNRVRAYFDSSALAKRYIVEPGTAEVLKHCSNASEIVLSILCIPELISAFNRLAREKKITRIQYKQLKTSMLMEVEHASLFDIGHPIIQRTIEYLESFPLRTLDAIHLATAMEAGCDLFITSDLKQAIAAKKLGLQVSEIK